MAWCKLCINAGITIKRGSIIGAGAIVTKNTEEFCTYAGVPAKKIRNYIK